MYIYVHTYIYIHIYIYIHPRYAYADLHFESTQIFGFISWLVMCVFVLSILEVTNIWIHALLTCFLIQLVMDKVLPFMPTADSLTKLQALRQKH